MPIGDGEYDLCADGIYVDGGCDIEICNNFIFNCDIGMEVATEHSPQIGVQRSMNNRVYANLILGGETAIEFNDDLSEEDMVNDISGNAAADFEDEDSWTDEYGELYADREEAAEEFRSLIDGVGSRFVPDEGMMELYRENAGMEE